MIEFNKDYTIFNKYENGKFVGLHIHYPELDHFDEENNVFLTDNVLDIFFNTYYNKYKDEIDNTIKKLYKGKVSNFEKDNCIISPYVDNKKFLLVINDDNNPLATLYTTISFEDYYQIRDNYLKALSETTKNIPSNIVSVKEKIDAFKKHYSEFAHECYKDCPEDVIRKLRKFNEDWAKLRGEPVTKEIFNYELEGNKDPSIYIPVFYEEDEQLKDYIMLVDFIYFDYDDTEMGMYYYDYNLNRIKYRNTVYHSDFRNSIILPTRKIKLEEEKISKWYSMYESLIALYNYDKDSFYYMFNQYKEYLISELMGRKFIEYIEPKFINEAKPFDLQGYCLKDDGTYWRYHLIDE